MTRSYGITVSKKKPVEPAWHKQLKPMAVAAGAYKAVGSPEVCAFKNLCKKLVASRVLVSFELFGVAQVYKVSWIARESQWSGSA